MDDCALNDGKGQVNDWTAVWSMTVDRLDVGAGWDGGRLDGCMEHDGGRLDGCMERGGG